MVLFQLELSKLLTYIQSSLFYELTALLAFSTLIGVFGQFLRQPMIVCFMIVGILVSPSALGIVHSYDNIEMLAELGVAVLLFLVGLKLDLKLIKSFGMVSFATGIGQVLFTAIIGYFIGIALGFNSITSLYVAVALTFSSTIIIVKLLSDKHEVDALHGRIAIGFLIVQDVVVVLSMIVISVLGTSMQIDTSDRALVEIAKIILYALLMLIFVGFFIRYYANKLIGFVASSTELLVIFSISWAALFAALGNYFGLSKELGGLLAGISLASTPFRETIIAKLSSLRDFLLLFFFIILGSHIELSLLGLQVIPVLVFSIFVLIGNPLIVMVIMGYMGYRSRTSFLAGLTVAQISEFSLIFMAMGIRFEHVNNDALGLVALVGLVTIALSVYMITYSHSLYRWLEPLLGFFERKSPYREETVESKTISKKHYDILIFGLGRYGTAIANLLRSEGLKILGVDYNPDAVKNWLSLGYEALYGDACDQEFSGILQLENIRWVVSSIPQYDLGLTREDPRIVLIDGLKKHNYKGKIAVSTHNDDVPMLQSKGADLVLLPFHDAAEMTVERIMQFK